MPATLGTYDELRARTRSFDVLAAADRWRPSLSGDGYPERLEGQRVTARYFSVFGAEPIFGRLFAEAEDQPGGPNVLIVSDRFLQRRLGGDRPMIGRTVDLDGDPYVVVGVMPNGFANVISPGVEVWRPMSERSTGDLNSRAWGHHYTIVGMAVSLMASSRQSREASANPSALALDRCALPALNV